MRRVGQAARVIAAGHPHQVSQECNWQQQTFFRSTPTTSSATSRKGRSENGGRQRRTKSLSGYDILRVAKGEVCQQHSPCSGIAAGGHPLSQTNTSIFDLSPSEKLQLVEDLWDDLAATPEAVPVHDWQKEELALRKAKLMKNPASGLTWEEVKRRARSRYGR